MIRHSELDQDVVRWQRKILNGYWAVVLISIMAEIVALFITIRINPENVKEYLIYTCAIPTGWQLSAMLFNEYMERRHKKARPYTVILTGVFFASVLIAANKTVDGIQYIMFLPMMASLFYFGRRYLVFAYCSIFVALASLYVMFPLVWTDMTTYEGPALFFIITGGFIVLVHLLDRGTEIFRKLDKASQSARELLVRNIVMERLSKVDALTDLYNHKTFHEYLDHLLEQCETNGLSMQLAVLDIDNFKTVNDTFGHAVGDIILKRVASTLVQCLTDDAIIARYGGEEFAVLFPGSTMDETYAKIELAREAIWQEQHPEMGDRHVSVSIGLCDYSLGKGKSRFFAEADSLLYKAKKGGKNQTALHP